MVSTMGKNWMRVCRKLLPNTDEQFTAADERKVLQIIEKNIYHKKPSMMAITVAVVRTVDYYN